MAPDQAKTSGPLRAIFDSCPECRGQERDPKVIVFYGPDVPDPPGESRCEACGRLIPYQYVFVGYHHHMKPDDMP